MPSEQPQRLSPDEAGYPQRYDGQGTYSNYVAELAGQAFHGAGVSAHEGSELHYQTQPDVNLYSDDLGGVPLQSGLAISPTCANQYLYAQVALSDIGAHLGAATPSIPQPADIFYHDSTPYYGLANGGQQSQPIAQSSNTHPEPTATAQEQASNNRGGRTKKLNPEQKESANKTRKKGGCIACRHRRCQCGHTQTPCNPCNVNQRFCFRVSKETKGRIPNLGLYAKELWLQECRSLAPDYPNLSLVVCLRLKVGHSHVQVFRVPLRPVDEVALGSECCPISRLHTPSMEDFVQTLVEAVVTRYPLFRASRGDKTVQDIANQCLACFLLLQRLPTTPCDRFHQVYDAEKTRCVIVAVYTFLVQHITSMLHRLLEKVVELTLPTKKERKELEQEYALSALAIAFKVTDMLADLQPGPASQMFSSLLELSEAAQRNRDELRSFCRAEFDSVKPKDKDWPSFLAFADEIWPDVSDIVFEISYSSSKLEEQPLESNKLTPTGIPESRRLLRERLDTSWRPDRNTADSILMDKSSEYAVQDPRTRTPSPSEAAKIQVFDQDPDLWLNYIDPKVLESDASNTNKRPPEQKALTRRGSNDLNLPGSAGVLFTYAPATPSIRASTPAVSIDSLAVEPSVTASSATEGHYTVFSWDKKHKRSESPQSSLASNFKKPRALTDVTSIATVPDLFWAGPLEDFTCFDE